jgi:RND family efflux transporter MFP subunit
VRLAEADLRLAETALAAAERVAERAQDAPGKAALRTSATADVSEAEVALQTAQANTRRLESLLPDGLATQQQVDAARTEEAAATARLESTKYQLRTVDDVADRARQDVEAARRDAARAKTASAEAKSRLETAERRHHRESALADEQIGATAQLANAETAVKVARANHERATAAWEREQTLHGANARSRDALSELLAAVSAARARLVAAHGRVNALGMGRQGTAGRISIVAPVSGKVSIRDARIGAMVEPGDVLLEITGVESVWIEAGFYEKDVPLLAVGQPVRVEVTAFPGEKFETNIHAIDPALDEHTRKATCRGIIDNADGRLLPDMFAKVRVRVGSVAQALAVPEQAVQNDGHCDFVFVEEDHGHFRRVEVQTGAHRDGYIEIRSGLEVGLPVVTDGAFLLKSEISEIAASCGHGH